MDVRVKGIGSDNSIYPATQFDDVEDMLNYISYIVETNVDYYISDYEIDGPRCCSMAKLGKPFVLIVRKCGTNLCYLDSRKDGSSLIWNYYSDNTEFPENRYLTCDPERLLVFEGKEAAEGFLTKNEPTLLVIKERAIERHYRSGVIVERFALICDNGAYKVVRDLDVCTGLYIGYKECRGKEDGLTYLDSLSFIREAQLW